MTPGRGMTPARGGVAGQTPLRTPVRDKLNINAEDDMDMESVSQYQQQEQKSHLKHGLASLPQPKNDFEIVLPEQDPNTGEEIVEGAVPVEDQADVDQRREDELAKIREFD